MYLGYLSFSFKLHSFFTPHSGFCFCYFTSFVCRSLVIIKYNHCGACIMWLWFCFKFPSLAYQGVKNSSFIFISFYLGGTCCLTIISQTKSFTILVWLLCIGSSNQSQACDPHAFSCNEYNLLMFSLYLKVLLTN